MKRNKGSISLVIGMLVVSILGGSNCHEVLAADFDRCNACHDQQLERESMQPYLHVPFSQQNCAGCHLWGVGSNDPKNPTAKPGVSEIAATQVNWLADSQIVEKKHVFLFPSEDVRETLIIRIRKNGAPITEQKFKVPLLSDLSDYPTPVRAPLLSNVKVLKVAHDVFLSATIAWETDSLADAMVSYGDQSLILKSSPSQRFGYKHQVRLYDLRPNENYKFQAISTDLFGRTSESQIQGFSTGQPFDANPYTISDSPFRSDLIHRLWRLDNHYLLELDLEEPAAVYVGTLGGNLQQVAAPASGGSISPDDSHSGLNSAANRTIGACRQCHTTEVGATHPVNVYPSPGMIIPSDYPTLPDGRITCASCHYSHGSENEYLARRPGKKELCVGCHRDML